MPPERLQKLLARAGYGSRRQCETMISSGRVHVNGRVPQLGEKADDKLDCITVDREPIGQSEQLTYIVLNKPRAMLSTLTKQGPRASLHDLIAPKERLYPVGLLDADSEGLILLTNDGKLTERLTHPRYGHEKEYHVLVSGYPNKNQLADWRRGVVLEDGVKTAPANVQFIRKGASGTWLRVIMREGRKRQIRRTAEVLMLRVKRLQRVRLSTLRLGKLAPGKWRQLSEVEISRLRSQVFVPQYKGSKRRSSHTPMNDAGIDS